MTRQQLEDEGDPGSVRAGLDDCFWCKSENRPGCAAEAACVACMCGACLAHGSYVDDTFFCEQCLDGWRDGLKSYMDDRHADPRLLRSAEALG